MIAQLPQVPNLTDEQRRYIPTLGADPKVYFRGLGEPSIFTKIKKSPPQTYEVGQAFTLKDEISTDRIILTQNGSTLITLDLKILIPEEKYNDPSYDRFQSWTKPGLVISWIHQERGYGYVIWSDLSTMTSRLFTETSEDAEVTMFSNGLLISGGEFPENTAYEMPSGIGHPMTTEACEINIVGVTETLDKWARDDQFFWFDYTEAIGRTGRIVGDHLLWTMDTEDYDYEMKINEINISKPKNPVYTMEQISTQSESWFDDLFKMNNLSRSEYLTDRLSAIILTHNAGMIIDGDIKYVRHSDFAKYMMMTEKQLGKEIAPKQEHFYTTPTRLNIIRRLLQ